MPQRAKAKNAFRNTDRGRKKRAKSIKLKLETVQKFEQRGGFRMVI
jgi:hypothetical protein